MPVKNGGTVGEQQMPETVAGEPMEEDNHRHGYQENAGTFPPSSRNPQAVLGKALELLQTIGYL